MSEVASGLPRAAWVVASTTQIGGGRVRCEWPSAYVVAFPQPLSDAELHAYTQLVSDSPLLDGMQPSSLERTAATLGRSDVAAAMEAVTDRAMYHVTVANPRNNMAAIRELKEIFRPEECPFTALLVIDMSYRPARNLRRMWVLVRDYMTDEQRASLTAALESQREVTTAAAISRSTFELRVTDKVADLAEARNKMLERVGIMGDFVLIVQGGDAAYAVDPSAGF